MVNENQSLEQYFLDDAQEYANIHSTCAKVKVGSLIRVRDIKADMKVNFYGCNHGVHNCVENGCRRIQLYGENSKEHRLPSDCDALHSEIDAICQAARLGFRLNGATIYVTRYPCEACARAIAASGIKKVVYGRKESISDYTKHILQSANVEIVKVEDWDEEDNND